MVRCFQSLFNSVITPCENLFRRDRVRRQFVRFHILCETAVPRKPFERIVRGGHKCEVAFADSLNRLFPLFIEHGSVKRSSRIVKPFSRIRVVVREQEEA